jgi:hypothetical protein
VAALALVCAAAASLGAADGAHAAGFVVGGGADAPGAQAPDDYVYTTRDVAVDLASPLVAYKVASFLFQQEVPKWLDAIIYASALGALYVVFSGSDALDKYLV